MIVCVTTSVTLLNSVLKKAGHSVHKDFHQWSNSSDLTIFDGGNTRARRILFIPWHTSAKQSNPTQDEEVYC